MSQIDAKKEILEKQVEILELKKSNLDKQIEVIKIKIDKLTYRQEHGIPQE